MIKVVKRDGVVVDLDTSKIENAIIKAMNQTDKGVDIELAESIAEQISNTQKKKLDVEEIQDVVEHKLMSSKRKDVAREYITYRSLRNIARGRKTYETMQSISNADDNEITKENANMNAESPAGMMMKFASESTKQFTDDMLLSKDVVQAIKENKIHVHDKDYYATKSLTCVQHPLDKILSKGFRAGHGSSRPAKRIETASMLACISLETIQNEMHTLNCAII